MAKSPEPRTARSRRARAPARAQPVLNVRADTLDFRDRMYEPTLIDVPERLDLERLAPLAVPILDQKGEGACTGFALATVAHYLLRTRRVEARKDIVSPHMLYAMARRYDEWPGEAYSGSSARGAMKGWHKHGVCSADAWKTTQRGVLNDLAAREATKRSLGAYFRVNHRDLVALHAALAEVGVLFASASVHAGWLAARDDASGRIRRKPGELGTLGGHAFAIVGYDREGFWIQNSWGERWGRGGFGHVSYDDWLANANDTWVARLAVPVELTDPDVRSRARSEGFGAAREALSQADLRPHVISLGNDGLLRETGSFGTSRADVEQILEHDFVERTKDWKQKRILLYAHGGLVSEAAALQRISEYREALLAHEVYPLAFVWKSDYWTTLKNILSDALGRRRSEGVLDATKDFLLDRLDDALEPVARLATGEAQWREMKENARLATKLRHGGANVVAQILAGVAKDPKVELHVVGHSAGSILHGPLVQLLTSRGRIAAGPCKGQDGLGLSIRSLTLWAPACTLDFFEKCYLGALRNGAIERFTLFTLTDEAERDDHCANIYHKSLLYLVAHAFEEEPRIPIFRKDGTPLLGMEKFVREHAGLQKLFAGKRHAWITSPNDEPKTSDRRSTARHHGDFDDDDATVASTLARICKTAAEPAEFHFQRSSASLRDRRKRLG